MPKLTTRAISYRHGRMDGRTDRPTDCDFFKNHLFRKLLEYGAQVDTESKAGFAPIHLASQERYLTLRHYLFLLLIITDLLTIKIFCLFYLYNCLFNISF